MRGGQRLSVFCFRLYQKLENLLSIVSGLFISRTMRVTTAPFGQSDDVCAIFQGPLNDQTVRTLFGHFHSLHKRRHPTLPSKLTPNNFCASTANSIGNSLNTSLQNPFTIMFTESSTEIPRDLQ